MLSRTRPPGELQPTSLTIESRGGSSRWAARRSLNGSHYSVASAWMANPHRCRLNRPLLHLVRPRQWDAYHGEVGGRAGRAAVSPEVKQKERSARAKGEMERRDKRLKEEENRLKAGEDQLRQREEYQRTRQGALREHREELRDRDQRLERAERRLERLEDIQKHRRERVEAGRRILEEPDRRYIVKDQTRVVIRHDETERLRKVTRDFRTERRRDGITVAYFTRPDGSRVISEVMTKAACCGATVAPGRVARLCYRQSMIMAARSPAVLLR